MSGISLSGNFDITTGDFQVDVLPLAGKFIRILSINQSPAISHVASGMGYDVTVSVPNDFTPPLSGGIVNSVKVSLFATNSSTPLHDHLDMDPVGDPVTSYTKTMSADGGQTVRGTVYVEWQILPVDTRDSADDTLP